MSTTSTKQQQHTPGPWRVMDGTDETGLHKYIQFMCASAPAVQGWGMVAKTVGVQGKPEELANARLIAAAPELLEAVGAAWAEMKFMATKPDWANVASTSWYSTLQKVTEAVAKATGGVQ
jgi:hypothetical protein